MFIERGLYGKQKTCWKDEIEGGIVSVAILNFSVKILRS